MAKQNNIVRYLVVKDGDRWQCIRCGSCCSTDFGDDWLGFLSTNQNPRTADDKCPNLKFENNRYTCSNYLDRPNACKAFPFTLRKQDNGNYKLVIHAKCRGYGKGRIINIKHMILQCLRYTNKEFHRKMRFDFTSFEISRSVILVK